MSRLQGHRKSQSTSALSVIANGGSGHASSSGAERKVRSRASQHPALGRVDEAGGASASVTAIPGLPTHSALSRDLRGEEMKRRHSTRYSEEEVRGWLSDIMSHRSSDRRRLAALNGLERALVRLCAKQEREEKGKHRASAFREGMTLMTLVDMQMHTGLINLLSRHAQSLTRHPTQDEVTVMVNELHLIVGILQGLCLTSRRCKMAVGESWVFEVLIDLLLILRTQPPATPSTPSSRHSSYEPKSIVYGLLDLLCCALVDSVENARTFEKLNGLEAVVRVLRGTGVAREIKMKCVEFLYFYLQPEAVVPSRSVSSSTSSSSSSGESALYPPSPLSSSTGSLKSDGRVSPSPMPSSASSRHFADLDIPFIPQTPKKPIQPTLGYLTPSTTRRVSGSTAATPSLAPITASPRHISPNYATAARPSVPETPSRRRESRDARRWSVMESATPSSNAGLGLGLPKSSSFSTGLSAAATGPAGLPALKRDVTAIKLDEIDQLPSPAFTDPFSPDSRSSSGSSTVVPRQSSGMSRSSTQPSLAIPSPSIARRVSARRSSKSPLVQSSVAPSPEKVAPTPRPPKMRHSRTQSHLSGLALPESNPTPPVPRVPSIHKNVPSTPSSRDARVPSASPMPTPAKRAFPAELTRGIPPSSSSPALGLTPPTPLGASRRIPSEKRESVDRSAETEKEGKSGAKSVEEKKKLLSTLLGNVDALVEGVEKVSFWGSIQQERRERVA